MHLSLKGKAFTPVVLLGLLGSVVFTRLPFVSAYLYGWDPVQLALGIHHLDISKHQPHPPGYILFVGLARIAYSLLKDDNRSLVFLAVILTAVSAQFLFLLALGLFEERRTAILASCLWITSPLLWFYGEVGESYGAAAFGSVATAYFAFRFWKEPTELKAIAASAVYAACGGMRPDLVVFMAPVSLFPYWQQRACRRFFPLGMGVFVLGFLAWYLPTLHFAGGYAHYSLVLHRQFIESVQSSTLLFGSKPLEQARTTVEFLRTIVVGILPVWFLLVLGRAWKRGQLAEPVAGREEWLFLAAWGIPAMLFYAFIHFGQRGYSLACLGPAVLLSARWTTLRILAPKKGARPLVLVTSYAMLLNTLFFFLARPIPYPASAGLWTRSWRFFAKAFNGSIVGCSYKDIYSRDRVKRAEFPAISRVLAEAPAVLVVLRPTEGYMDWRSLMYYFPAVPVYRLGGLERPVRGALRIPGPAWLVVGFWRDNLLRPQFIAPHAEEEPALVHLSAWKRALIVLPADDPGLVITAASKESVRDVTPADIDPRLKAYRLILFAPNPDGWLSLRGETLWVSICP